MRIRIGDKHELPSGSFAQSADLDDAEIFVNVSEFNRPSGEMLVTVDVHRRDGSDTRSVSLTEIKGQYAVSVGRATLWLSREELVRLADLLDDI